MTDDAEGRQNHDVHLGMAEEPENVLIHHRIAAAGRIEEAGAKVAVGQRHGDGACQHGHHRYQQVGGDQPSPAKHRHFHQRHAGCAHVQNGHDDVDRTHDGRSTQDMHRKNTRIHGWAHLQRQRRVQRPARSGRTARHEERACKHQAGRNQQPEAEIIHARKSHVGCANLQRNHPVCEADKGRHDGAEHHDQAVHGGELIEQLRVHQLQSRLEQLGADQQRKHTAEHQHEEAEQQVQRAYVFVVGGKNPATPACRSMVVVMRMIGMV